MAVETVSANFKNCLSKHMPSSYFIFLSTSIGILVTGTGKAILNHMGMEAAHKGKMTLKEHESLTL